MPKYVKKSKPVPAENPKPSKFQQQSKIEKKIVILSNALGAKFGRTRLVLPGGKVRMEVRNEFQYKQFEALNLENINKARERDDKQTECGFCLKQFSDRRNAVEHIEAKHKGKPEMFVCSCGCEFVRLANLRKHMKNVKAHN